MNTSTEFILKEDGVLEILEQPLEDAVVDRGVVNGHWKSDGSGHAQKLEPYFFLPAGGMVNVTTNVFGSCNVTLNLYNVSGNYPGPSFPQTGGSGSLSPGQWRLYFTGWIGTLKKSGVEVRVQFPGFAAETEEVEPEESIEEESSTIFKARGKGSSRPQAIRIAYRRADGQAGGRPYRVINQRVWAEANYWVCMLTCELI